MDALNRRVALLGLAFDDLPLAAAAARILQRPPELPFTYVVTPNADHLARLRREPALRPVYEAAWLCLLDSRLLALAADALRLPRPALAPGADLTALLLPQLSGVTVAVIGLEPAAFAALRQRFPAIDWRHHAPPLRLSEHPQAFVAAVEFAVATPARLTFIGLGAPLQERLAAAIAARPGASGVGLCIGAALHFAAGVAPRAPGWMRGAGLEWLHRLAHDPRRLARRYLRDDPPVLAALIRAAVRFHGSPL